MTRLATTTHMGHKSSNPSRFKCVYADICVQEYVCACVFMNAICCRQLIRLLIELTFDFLVVFFHTFFRGNMPNPNQLQRNFYLTMISSRKQAIPKGVCVKNTIFIACSHFPKKNSSFFGTRMKFKSRSF